MTDTTPLISECFKGPKLFFSILGLRRIKGCPHFVWRLYSTILYILSMTTFPTLGITYMVLLGDLNIQTFIERSFTMPQVIVLAFKQLPFLLHPENIKRTMEDWHATPIFLGYRPDQRKFLEKSVEKCNKFFYIIFVLCIVCISAFMLRPVFTDTNTPIMDLWMPKFVRDSGHLLLLQNILSCIIAIDAGISESAIDTVIYGLTMQAVSQLQILRDNLENLGRRLELPKCETPEEEEKIKNEMIYQDICKCIQHHVAIRNYIDDVQTTYAAPILSQFLASFIIICISLYQSTVVEIISGDFFSAMSYTIVIVIELFMWCYVGKLMETQSSGLIDSVYESDWIYFDKKCKAALIMLMEDAKLPVKITVGGIFDMSLETFTKIMRLTYSTFCLFERV